MARFAVHPGNRRAMGGQSVVKSSCFKAPLRLCWIARNQSPRAIGKAFALGPPPLFEQASAHTTERSEMADRGRGNP